ncbi:MAG: septal ring lytic transglycosylase RlpA family protein [Solirubrobacteraceae bacterium]
MSQAFRAAFVAALTTASIATPSALADTGSGGSTAPAPGGSSPTPQPQDPPAGDATPTGRDDVLLGGKARFSGTVDGAREGDEISIQRRDPAAGWVEEATTTAGPGGAFTAKWTADESGSFQVRGVAQGQSGRADAAQASPGMTLTVYRPTMASTFYDRITACGTLRPTTLGVAHKTLPCGTKVAFFYGGRTLTVPVVDRGPYRRGFTWDLTEAAADKLGFEGIGKVGSLVVSRPATTRRR